MNTVLFQSIQIVGCLLAVPAHENHSRNFLLCSFLSFFKNDSSGNSIGFFSGSGNVCSSGGGGSCFFFAISQPFGSMPCRRNSARANSLNQLPRLTPELAAASSNCSRNSGAILIWNVGDFPKLDCLLSLLTIDMYVPIELMFNLMGTYNNTYVLERATPRSAGTLPRRLTKPLTKVTIMAETQSTQTRPKYQYRFLALDRADPSAKLRRLSVEATSEQEARRILAPHFILAFAARLPVDGGAQ